MHALGKILPLCPLSSAAAQVAQLRVPLVVGQQLAGDFQEPEVAALEARAGPRPLEDFDDSRRLPVVRLPGTEQQ